MLHDTPFHVSIKVCLFVPSSNSPTAVQGALELQATLFSALFWFPAALGLSTTLQEAPSQDSTSVCLSEESIEYPTAVHAVAEEQETVKRSSKFSFPAFGLATTLQAAPFHDSIRVCRCEPELE